nr:hypothetical protein CFP56_65728 [Quercus suber]
MRIQKCPSKTFVHKARPSHGEVVQANGIDTRPYLLRAEEQGRGIVKKAVHPYGWTSHPHSDILSLPKVEQTR